MIKSDVLVRSAVSIILAAALSACVSNSPQGIVDGLNTASSIANTAQQLKGGQAIGAANYGAGNADVAAMQVAPNDPRYKRAEAALVQLRLNTASCQQMSNKQQATLNSLEEIDPLTGNLMFKQLHERLRIQKDSLSEIAKSKKCKLPTVAKSSAATTTKLASSYGKMNCRALNNEYKKVAAATPSASDTANKVQGAVSTFAQVGSMFGGNSIAATQKLAQANQATNAIGTLQQVSDASGGSDAYAKKTEIEQLAQSKGCTLN